MCAQNETDLKHLGLWPQFSLSQHSKNVSSASSLPSAFLGLTMLQTGMPNCSNKNKPSCDASKKNRNFQKSPEKGLAHEVFGLNWGAWSKFRGNTQAFEHFITLSPCRLSHYLCLVLQSSSSEVQPVSSTEELWSAPISILCSLPSEFCFRLVVSEEYLLANIIFSWNDITASKPSLGQQYHMDKRLFSSHVTQF